MKINNSQYGLFIKSKYLKRGYDWKIHLKI